MLVLSNCCSRCVLRTPGSLHSQIFLLHVSPTFAVWLSEVLKILRIWLWVLGHLVAPFWQCWVGGAMCTSLPSWSLCAWPLERGAGTCRTKIANTEYTGQRICSTGPPPAGRVQSAALGGVAPGADPGRGTGVMDPTLLTTC